MWWAYAHYPAEPSLTTGTPIARSPPIVESRMWHGGGGGWWSYMRGDEDQKKPTFSRAILTRVAGYGRPYLGQIVVMLLTVLGITGIGLLPPLLMRDLIDHALPDKDLGRL